MLKNKYIIELSKNNLNTLLLSGKILLTNEVDKEESLLEIILDPTINGQQFAQEFLYAHPIKIIKI